MSEALPLCAAGFLQHNPLAHCPCQSLSYIFSFIWFTLCLQTPSSHSCYSALPVRFASPHKIPESLCLLSSYNIQAYLCLPVYKCSPKLHRFKEFISWDHFVRLHKLVWVTGKAARLKRSNNSPQLCIQDSSAQMRKLWDSVAQAMQ